MNKMNQMNKMNNKNNRMREKTWLLASLLLTTTAASWAGDRHQQPYPIQAYDEPRVETTAEQAAEWKAEWDALAKGLHATWGSRDLLYSLHRPPRLAEKAEAEIAAWRGERANLSAVLYSKAAEGKLRVRFVDESQREVEWCKARFQNYLITDDYKRCGDHDMKLAPWLVPDIIDNADTRQLAARETRPVWCSIEVPRTLEPGPKKLFLQVLDGRGRVVRSLALTLHVDAHTLPLAAEQKFHLDLWQQPYAVSRYYGAERWSDEHIAALRPYLAALGKAGQKVVSAIMFYEPWGVQTHDKFSPMVKTTRRADGSWAYDYAIFDKYVELCAEYGIREQINCYSMVPWDMKFRYYDEALGAQVDLCTSTSTAEYRELWTQFLRSFKRHLQQKGWFEKTCIAMDERGESAMLDAYAVAHELGFRMALAGNYHASLADKLQDYCVALDQVGLFTPRQREHRRQQGMKTTVYVSCADTEPNIYTNSLPAEAAFLPIHAAANDLDGFLHWSWINWDEHPLTDSRFRLFGSGDTYCYYPGNRSSVRFERLVEGIQQYEKIQILKQEYKTQPEKLRMLQGLLADFKDRAVAGADCADKVNTMEAFLNGKLKVTKAYVNHIGAFDAKLTYDGDKSSSHAAKLTYTHGGQEKLTLFSTRSGGMGIPPYRIPGISCGKGGRLVATAARLVCGTDPGYGRVDCVAKVSLDNGLTWSTHEIEVAQGDSTLINNVKTPMGAAYGDPAVVADRGSDEVLVMCVAGCTVYGRPSTTRQNPNMMAAIRSLDGGLTWQQPIDMTEPVYGLFDQGHPMQAAFFSGGRIFQSRRVRVGKYYRLYAALCGRPGGNRVIYSDDFGRSWRALGGASALPVPEGDEAKCEELPDGRVIITSRTSGGRWMNIYAFSDLRKGSGSWGVPAKATMPGLSAAPSANPTNGEMLIVPARRQADGKPLHLMLQSVPTGKERTNVGIFYKELADESDYRDVASLARGWDGFYQVSDTTSAYSSLDLQADGRIAFLLEETHTWWGRRKNPVSTDFPKGEGFHNFDGFENVYVPLTLESITDGKYSFRRESE